MRHAPKLFAAVVAATLAGAALAQDYPNRSSRMVVPFPPAGGTDNLARLVVSKVSAELGQSLVLGTRAGAGGTLGAGVVAEGEAGG